MVAPARLEPPENLAPPRFPDAPPPNHGSSTQYSARPAQVDPGGIQPIIKAVNPDAPRIVHPPKLNPLMKVPTSLSLTPSPKGVVRDFEVNERNRFISRVYAILSAQLVVTAIICGLAMKHTSESIAGYKVLSLGTFLANNLGFQIFIFIFSFLMLFVIFRFQKTYPANLGLLLFWTVLMSFSVATSCAISVCDPMVQTPEREIMPFSVRAMNTTHTLYQDKFHCAIGTEQSDAGGDAVLMAGSVTGAIFFSLTIFTWVSKIDFSWLGAALYVALMILVLWGLGMLIFGRGRNVYYIYCLSGAVIFSLFIIFDTWKICAVYSCDEYIEAALQL